MNANSEPRMDPMLQEAFPTLEQDEQAQLRAICKREALLAFGQLVRALDKLGLLVENRCRPFKYWMFHEIENCDELEFIKVDKPIAYLTFDEQRHQLIDVRDLAGYCSTMDESFAEQKACGEEAAEI